MPVFFGFFSYCCYQIKAGLMIKCQFRVIDACFLLLNSWTGFVTTLCKMSRPMLLVFLLIILIITSQFEWKQQLVIDLDTAPSISRKQQHVSKREEAVKEKVQSLYYCLCFCFLFEQSISLWWIKLLIVNFKTSFRYGCTINF